MMRVPAWPYSIFGMRRNGCSVMSSALMPSFISASFRCLTTSFCRTKSPVAVWSALETVRPSDTRSAVAEALPLESTVMVRFAIIGGIIGGGVITVPCAYAVVEKRDGNIATLTIATIDNSLILLMVYHKFKKSERVRMDHTTQLFSFAIDSHSHSR